MHNENVQRAMGILELFISSIDILYVNRKFNNYLLGKFECSYMYTYVMYSYCNNFILWKNTLYFEYGLPILWLFVISELYI